MLLGSSIEDQTKQALNNLRAIVNSSGSQLDNVLKTTIYLANLSDFSTVNALYSAYFDGLKGLLPARTTVEVSKLPLGALIEIDAIVRIDIE